jgi:hypothetical protein
MGEQIFTMQSKAVGWPSVASDDLVYSADQNIYERRHFTKSELSCEFPQFHALFCEIVAVRLGYHTFCATRVPKILTGVDKAQRMASALTFLEQYESLNYIVPVTGDET